MERKYGNTEKPENGNKRTLLDRVPNRMLTRVILRCLMENAENGAEKSVDTGRLNILRELCRHLNLHMGDNEIEVIYFMFHDHVSF
ncbi:hypothetical protein HA466_0193260 [Hirschfeldia incana]|nr:hypothetical protein HA466_0193260 [Hirschfeldia incana]KAJ0244102.1 hypothetical protein HA466_0193260 [Hirschfeldia incana]